MTEPNPREIAEQLILDHAADIEHLTITEHLDDYGLSPEDEDRIADEIHKLIDNATITVVLPQDVP